MFLKKLEKAYIKFEIVLKSYTNHNVTSIYNKFLRKLLM